jgi:hypothetical protein
VSIDRYLAGLRSPLTPYGEGSLRFPCGPSRDILEIAIPWTTHGRPRAARLS